VDFGCFSTYCGDCEALVEREEQTDFTLFLYMLLTKSNMPMKHIDYLAPYNMYIFDPDDNKKAEIIVHIAGWRVSNQNGRPALHLYKSNNSTWFGYFLDQFNKMWKFAEEKNGEKENDNTNNYK
jgi:hypothetical protein